MLETSMNPHIKVSQLYKKYGSTVALDNFNMEIKGPQVVGLFGENGCGKTTLIKIMAGLITNYKGEVTINGFSPGTETKQQVSYLPDRLSLREEMRLREYLDLYSLCFADFDRDKAQELINYFNLKENVALSKMSKGMREKTQITLAIARQVPIYIFDEPLSGVDPAARQDILEGILANFCDGALLLISTHLIHDLESVVDQAVMMRNGRVLLQGQADEIRDEHGESLEELFKEMYRR